MGTSQLGCMVTWLEVKVFQLVWENGKWKMETLKFEIRSITGPTLTVECDTGEFYKAGSWQLVTTTENLKGYVTDVVEKEVRLSAGNLERKLSKSNSS
ncbi:unnamed protein product [Ambrosiozyma monospora]|uniref:Unnamed protein product n=1 Tax=Ambrosiozyma monospora TaxID=43982 RepID=A0A9W6Z5C4_AMBMO|nr:unnamed protein product [Ambrosiozyma monospora]